MQQRLFQQHRRIFDIRCTCKLNGRVLRKQTLPVTTHFCRGASAAKVGSEPKAESIKGPSVAGTFIPFVGFLQWQAGRVPGSRTLSITWITPLSASIFAITTLALSPVPSAIDTPDEPLVMHNRSEAKTGLK